jgi:hypothetical protein
MSGGMQNLPPGQQGDGPQDEDSKPRDYMAPPEEPCECFCLHCRRIFMSDQMWFQRVRGARDGFEGFWKCPTANCSGGGFTMDIFPTDPEHPANEGWHYDDDEEGEGEETCDEEFEEGDADAVWDPGEPGYKMFDDMAGDEDDDMEGEEWKYGLQPGELPEAEAPAPGVEPRNWREEEALYDAPDRRPREVDWSDREYPPPAGPMSDEDIPF